MTDLHAKIRKLKQELIDDLRSRPVHAAFENVPDPLAMPLGDVGYRDGRSRSLVAANAIRTSRTTLIGLMRDAGIKFPMEMPLGRIATTDTKTSTGATMKKPKLDALEKAERLTQRYIDQLRGEGIVDPLGLAFETRAIRAAEQREMDRGMKLVPQSQQLVGRRCGTRLEFGVVSPDDSDAAAPASTRRPADAPASKRRPAPRDPAREANEREMDRVMGTASTQPAVQHVRNTLVFNAGGVTPTSHARS